MFPKGSPTGQCCCYTEPCLVKEDIGIVTFDPGLESCQKIQPNVAYEPWSAEKHNLSWYVANNLEQLQEPVEWGEYGRVVIVDCSVPNVTEKQLYHQLK